MRFGALAPSSRQPVPLRRSSSNRLAAGSQFALEVRYVEWMVQSPTEALGSILDFNAVGAATARRGRMADPASVQPPRRER